MPHGNFTNVSLTGDGKILVEGEFSLHAGGGDHRPIAIEVALVAVDNSEKRVEGRPSSLSNPWSAELDLKASNGEMFTVNEVVVVVGGALHEEEATGHPNPFVWHGFYRVGAEGTRQRDEVKLVPARPPGA